MKWCVRMAAAAVAALIGFGAAGAWWPSTRVVHRVPVTATGPHWLNDDQDVCVDNGLVVAPSPIANRRCRW